MRKPLSSLVPDLRSALRDATIEVAHDVTLDLKMKGPYWDGVFEESWEIRAGDATIPATVPGKDPPSKVNQPRGLTAPVVPRIAAQNLKGFTIGNRTEYREIAMDLVPGRLKGDNTDYGGTAPQDWFENYLQGGQADITIRQATDRAMRAWSF
jgi:hypothetical protein